MGGFLGKVILVSRFEGKELGLREEVENAKEVKININGK